MKKLLFSVIAVTVLAISSYSVFEYRKQSNIGKVASDFISYAGDVIGTKSVTTTTGVGFRVTSTGGQSATSSYVSVISGKTAVYTLKALAASSTANLRFEIQGSHDAFCETDGSSGSDPVALSDINWFSAGDNSPNKAQTTSLTNSSSTVFYTWNNPMPGVGQQIILDNLTYHCLRLNVSGSSTVLWAQISTK